MGNKYAEELRREKEILKKSNPFQKLREEEMNFRKSAKLKDEDYFGLDKNPFYAPKTKSSNYFHLILDSDYESLELDIRGLRYAKIFDPKTQKERVVLERKENHYLSEDGAEDLLMELKGHLSSDIKLGHLTHEEFLQTQEIIRKVLILYVQENLLKLGMDTEEKQRKAIPLLVMILNRVRAVYSRSIKGVENERSHGDIKLSGELDWDRENKFKLEDAKN